MGKVGTAEVDFIASGDVYAVIDTDGKMLECELTPLDSIKDHNLKYLITMD